jgi:bifunctional polynucleotide phosphatase/kinase
MSKAIEHLKEGKSVAIDNTNPDQELRQAWINLASKHNASIRCFHFTASKELARHNDAVRAMNAEVKYSSKSIILSC